MGLAALAPITRDTHCANDLAPRTSAFALVFPVCNNVDVLTLFLLAIMSLTFLYATFHPETKTSSYFALTTFTERFTFGYDILYDGKESGNADYENKRTILLISSVACV